MGVRITLRIAPKRYNHSAAVARGEAQLQRTQTLWLGPSGHFEVMMNTIRTYYVGLGYGSVLAMVISYTQNHSVLWAIIDSMLSWFYVLYHLIFQ